MKKAIALLLLVWSCTDKKETTIPIENSFTLVFFDKTQSVNPQDPFVRSKYAAALQHLIDQHINTEGDILEVYYIHENTSKSKALTIKSRTTKEDMAGLSPTDREAAQNAYDLSIKKERQLIHQALMQKFMEANTSSSNAETNVSASTGVIAAATAVLPRVHAYFFSDMVESLKKGRDFHKTPPASPAQAGEWATADKNSYPSLAGAHVHIYLPFSPNSSSKINNPNVSEYWKQFFQGLGAASVTEE
jgi:hypothetical protein